MTNHTPRVLAFALLVALSSTVCRADVVYSNFGPGDSYIGGSGWTVSGSTSSVGEQIYSAGPFTAGATAYNLTSAELALFHVSGTNQVNVSLYSNAAGAPGISLATGSPITGITGLGSGAIYTSTFAPFLLSPGTTFWLVASPGASDTWAAWTFNNIGAVGLAQQIDGGAWTVTPNASPAFRINGTLAAPLVPTPTAAAGGIALLGMLIGTRRRHESM